MQKFRDISNFSNVKTFPNIRAHEYMPNYSVVEADQINLITSYATPSTPAQDLCVVMQGLWNRTGDLYFGDRMLHQGEAILLVGLASLATRFLDVGASNITDSLDTDGAWLVATGDALVPDSAGNWVVGTAPTSGIYLKVTGFTSLPSYGSESMTEPAVITQIIAV